MERLSGTVQEQKFAGQLVLRGLVETAKPTLTGMSVLTAICAFYVATPTFDFAVFGWTIIGLFLVGSSAGALNQLVERDLDALMRRTERRPLPSGRLTPAYVMVFGVTSAIAGLSILFVLVNLLSGLLAALTLFLYLVIYTPLKRRTQLATIVGAIPGALPPLIGWVSASGSIGQGGILLFLLLYFWQLPHFLSLGFLYSKDYRRAGFQIGAGDNGGGATRIIAAFASVFLIPVGVGLHIVGTAGSLYAAGISAFGVIMAVVSLIFVGKLGRSQGGVSQSSNRLARRVFTTSLLYLPSAMLLLVLDKG